MQRPEPTIEIDRMGRTISRRRMLEDCTNGFGMLALAGMLAGEARAESSTGASSGAASPAVNPLAVQAPHHAPRAKRVIFLFMPGGPSHVDLFDPKPRLTADNGKPLPFEKPKLDAHQDRQPAGLALEVSASTASRASTSASCFRTWPAASTTCA